MIPAFSACTESPEPGISTSRTVSAMPTTSTSLWPVPTVSSEDEVLAGGVEHEQRLERRLGEPAEVAARAHRADEDARVEKVVGEPDPVAEQRTLGERARRVDRDDADRRSRARERGGRAPRRGSTCRRPAARSVRPRTPGRCADTGRATSVVGERVAVLDERDRPCESAPVATADAGDEGLTRPVATAGHRGNGSDRTRRSSRRRAPAPARRRRAARGRAYRARAGSRRQRRARGSRHRLPRSSAAR